MQCGTSKLTWPIFVYFRLHYTLCKGSVLQAPSRDGEAATNPVPCSKQHSALVFSAKSSTPITKMARKHQDEPLLPPFSIVRFLSQGRDEFFYCMCIVAFLKCFSFHLFNLFFKATLCTNFGRRSRGVSLELSEYSRESSKTAALYFPSLPVRVQMHRDIFLTVAPSWFSIPG